VGTGAACKSTIVKMVNRGETLAACDQLLRWTKAGGKVVEGLVNRRNAERNLCIFGLNKPSSK
jgi:lysozyme